MGPGAGKTSMIQALAGRFGRNLCYLSPTHPELSDDSLKSAIERVPDNAIVVLEDVDAIFGKNREKKTAKNTFQVYRWHIKYQFWQRVGRVVARPVSSVVLPEETSTKL